MILFRSLCRRHAVTKLGGHTVWAPHLALRVLARLTLVTSAAYHGARPLLHPEAHSRHATRTKPRWSEIVVRIHLALDRNRALTG